jgi:protein-S-isoprenylcysteine O-methyltransferase Ste14
MSDESAALRFLVRKRTTFTWIVPILLFAASLKWGKANWLTIGIGVASLAIGEIIRLWAAGTIHKDNVVSTTGPYHYVRNPLYLGSFFLAMGYGLMSGVGLWAWIAVIALFLLFHLSAIISEEAFLKEKFGEPYLQYIKDVPRLCPRLFAPKSESSEFDWSQVWFNREPTTALVTLITAAIFVARFLMASKSPL